MSLEEAAVLSQVLDTMEETIRRMDERGMAHYELDWAVEEMRKVLAGHYK